ncbi:hypothetical protein KTI26_12090 [Acinetobacter ursingii]|uniref:hypothetical protein n=1 Tax=Acinetobacter ursingii TaxID=108980 RepID=UPI00124F7FD2|nr:hypothetical protein [Acinetobacter ursingii]MCU4489919.1 hypothetical protein [Acinetobacter ursingii]
MNTISEPDLIFGVMTYSEMMSLRRVRNDQKGTEVLALEAKEVIINLSTLQNLQNEMYEEIFDNVFFQRINKSKRQEYAAVIQKLNKSINFISLAVKNNELQDCSSRVLSQTIIFLSDLDRIEEGNKTITFSIKLIEPSDAYLLMSMMLDLSLYKTVNKKYSK